MADSRGRNDMKKIIVYFILIIIFAGIISFVQNSDEFSWQRAKIGNKSTDYAQYLKKHPNGWHVLEAEKRYDQQSWNEAVNGATIEYFENYIKQNPDGLYISSAIKYIQNAEWYRTAAKNSIKDYEKFIEQYPESDYVNLAKNNIEDLNWKEVESKKDIEQIKKFIDTYPDGKHRNQAIALLESLIWEDAKTHDEVAKYNKYAELFPTGNYIGEARAKISQWPIFIDSYHLYDLTAADTDYGYIFLNKIKDILTDFNNIKIVKEESDALVHLQVGYALSFRDGQPEEDNIAKFLENSLRDRTLIRQQSAFATFDIGLHLYLWDIGNDCLLAYSSSTIPPEPGNATIARTVGRDRFLDDLVKIHIDNSIINELPYLVKGKDGVMNMKSKEQKFFFRHDMGKPQKRVSVKFENGPISTYHWRDPTIESYIYYKLQQSGIDIVRTFDNRSYQLLVLWMKYDRRLSQPNTNSPLRPYGLWADFIVNEKNENQVNYKVFEKSVLSDIRTSEYGLLPIEVIGQWRKNFDDSYVLGNITGRLRFPLVVDSN